jgi:hypothetical protein
MVRRDVVLNRRRKQLHLVDAPWAEDRSHSKNESRAESHVQVTLGMVYEFLDTLLEVGRWIAPAT